MGKKLKRQIFIHYFACKDEGVSWYAKVITASVVGYAFSPNDLIPDFIPILGYLEDVFIVPLGNMLALRMRPKNVLSDCKVKAEIMIKNVSRRIDSRISNSFDLERSNFMEYL